jgi:hypothetical protein
MTAALDIAARLAVAGIDLGQIRAHHEDVAARLLADARTAPGRAYASEYAATALERGKPSRTRNTGGAWPSSLLSPPPPESRSARPARPRGSPWLFTTAPTASPGKPK